MGGMVVRLLLQQGEDPVGLDVSNDFTFLPDIKGQFEYVRGDLLDQSLLMDVVKRTKVDRIIHTAAMLPDLARGNPSQALKVNIIGTDNIVQVLRAFDVPRLVFTSTKGILADPTGEYAHPDYKPLDEDAPVIPPRNTHTLYNDTKVFCEHYLHKCMDMWGLDVVMLRFATIYGPGRIRHGNRQLVGKWIEEAYYGRPVRVAQGGDQKDEMVYLKDVARSCILASHAATPEHKTFHISSGELKSYRQVVDTINELMPNADVEIGPGLDPMQLGMVGYSRLDISRARSELGYEPAYPLELAIPDYTGILDQLPAIEPY